jgi:thymidylate kinase
VVPPAACSAVTAPLATTARPARFVVLEGLSAVGKNTIAPLLAPTLNADLVDTQLPELTQARRYVDEQRSVNARLHFWLMANYAVSDVVRSRLRAGRDVVIESYFYRTLATHAAMGARPLPTVDWDRAAVPDLAIELTLHEPLRQRRLTARKPSGPNQYWSELAESGLATLRTVYDSFDLTPLDTTDLTPAQVVDRIQQLLAMARTVTFSGADNVC